MTASVGYRMQYGCGLSAPAGWKNFDASPTLRFERLPFVGRFYTKNENRFPDNVGYGDIVKQIPLPKESCKAIYASHVLEHLSLQDFRTALTNTYDLLMIGGLFRLVVPDLEILAKRYLESDDLTAAITFMEDSNLGRLERRKGLRGLATTWLGNSSHLWMWDLKSMQRELSAKGFKDIRRCSLGDEPLFVDVEDPSRFVDALAVQCRKG
jgi:predicted SAM-dependent methyltransferase